MSDEIEHQEDEEENEDQFMVTGRMVIEAGMNSKGELQWRWKNEDIEPALALGFVVVMEEELKKEIQEAIEEGDEF